MRKLLALGVCALVLSVSCQQEAQAWLNFKFGAGVNWSWQAGGNSVCGMRSGQPPGYGYGDPSCMPKRGGNCQQMMPQCQQCPPPWLWQQPCGPQGGPIFPNLGCQPSSLNDANRVTWAPDNRSQSFYSPCSSWYPNNTGYHNSCYGPYGAPNYYYPYAQTTSSYYHPGYQAVPYYYGGNYQMPWYNYNTAWAYNHGW